jgi:YHS domain-containing protein
MIFRLVVILLILTLIRALLVRLMNPSGKRVRSGDGRRRSAFSRRVMVKDPQCGMYVAPELAIAARLQGGTIYFCSKQCQDNYIRGQLKRQNG